MKQRLNKTIEKINKTKSWFFEMNKINKSLARLIKEKKKPTKIRNEYREIIINTTEIQRIIREYVEQLYTNKLDNKEEMDKFSGNIQSSKTES